MNDFADSLSRYMAEFVGYGPLTAKSWFLGPEQAGVENVEDLRRTLTAWEELGASPVVDLHTFHTKLGVTRFFGENAPTQSTWRKLIRIALLIEGVEPTPQRIREYQANQLGRQEGDVLIGELLPLPKKSYASWPYGELASEHSNLKDRKTYLESVLPMRVAMMRKLIAAQRPERVLFYGTSGVLRPAWLEVAGVSMEPVEGGYMVGRNAATTFVLFAHPVARGRTNEYFERVASLAKR